jgi:hypothetical protein
MGNYPAHYAYPSSPPVVRVLPPPVRLHWAIVLVLNLVTRGVFGAVWLLVQAYWVKRVRGSSNAFVWSIVHLCAYPVLFFVAIVVGIAMAVLHMDSTASAGIVGTLMILVFFAIVVLYFGTVYTLRSELEELPIGLTLGPIMTFFFGTVYFQYHLQSFSFDQVNTTPGSALGLNAVPVIVPVEQDKSL